MNIQRTMKVKPADGLQVRKPDFSLLNQEGETVDTTSYWVRRVSSGDVIEVTDEKPAGAAAGSKSNNAGSK